MKSFEWMRIQYIPCDLHVRDANNRANEYAMSLQFSNLKFLHFSKAHIL